MAPPNVKIPRSPRDLDEDDFDFEYFSRTYKPLSNLPTPPPSSRNSIASTPVLGDEELDDSAKTLLLGPAVHLANLHPPSATITAPSIPVVQAILTRAVLPREIIALAVCILDSLDAKFSRKWRMSLPLGPAPPPDSSSRPRKSKRHTIHAAAAAAAAAATAAAAPPTHIDLVSPELVILAALVVAFKFADDCDEPTRYFAADWGRGRWTCAQINTTERCIMEHLGYRLLPLCDPALLADAVADMKRAGRAALRENKNNKNKTADQQQQAGHARSVSVPVRAGGGGCEAAVGLGVSLTPVETPTEEWSHELGAPR